MQTDRSTWVWLAVIGGLLLLRYQGCQLPTVLKPSKVTAVVYTYDDKATSPPVAVQSALDKLNTNDIMATMDEVDTVNGGGEIPLQYRVSRPAAVAAGLPALVVLSDGKVLRTVKAPTTEEQVLEAAK